MYMRSDDFMPSPIEILVTEIPDVCEIRPPMFQDDRGFFMESYNADAWRAAKLDFHFVQDNLSCSAKGVMRGLHYQLEPHGMGKLVRVISGAIFDVAVDIRKGSPYFGRWVGRELHADTPAWLWIPVGFAHGFLSLQEDTRVYYKCTAGYAAESERGIRHNDPAIGIAWPGDIVKVSPKDAAAPGLAEAEYNFIYSPK
jgi:dTDP-4-dehydrorhamnose 3,5-epimerase